MRKSFHLFHRIWHEILNTFLTASYVCLTYKSQTIISDLPVKKFWKSNNFWGSNITCSYTVDIGTQCSVNYFWSLISKNLVCLLLIYGLWSHLWRHWLIYALEHIYFDTHLIFSNSSYNHRSIFAIFLLSLECIYVQYFRLRTQNFEQLDFITRNKWRRDQFNSYSVLKTAIFLWNFIYKMSALHKKTKY